LGKLQEEGLGELEPVPLSDTLVHARAMVLRSMERGSQRRSKGVRIVGRIPADLMVRGQPEFLVEAVECLLSNAARMVGKHTDGWTEIEARRQDRQAAITIQDNGPGFDERRLREGPRWFATSSPRVNFGVGVPFADEVFRACGGSMHLGNRPDS